MEWEMPMESNKFWEVSMRPRSLSFFYFFMTALLFGMLWTPQLFAEDPSLDNLAQQILLALKNQDGPALAKFVHPSEGIRFTPYAWDDLAKNIVLKPKEVAGVFKAKGKKLWGNFDSGDPIQMTPAKYIRRFVWNTDYTAVKEKKWEPLKGHLEQAYHYLDPSAVETILQTYPDAQVVTYSYPGITGPQGGAMDWSWLTLIFRAQESEWFLVGIVHREWTI